MTLLGSARAEPPTIPLETFGKRAAAHLAGCEAFEAPSPIGQVNIICGDVRLAHVVAVGVPPEGLQEQVAAMAGQVVPSWRSVDVDVPRVGGGTFPATILYGPESHAYGAIAVVELGAVVQGLACFGVHATDDRQAFCLDAFAALAKPASARIGSRYVEITFPPSKEPAPDERPPHAPPSNVPIASPTSGEPLPVPDGAPPKDPSP